MSRNMPQGFRQIESTLPDIVDYDTFSEGEPVIYQGARTVRGSDRKEYTVQVFTLDANSTEPFAVWGTAQLDAKLREVRAGSPVWVKYDGKSAHPQKRGQTIHNWQVALPDSRAEVETAEPGKRTTKRNPFADRRA